MEQQLELAEQDSQVGGPSTVRGVHGYPPGVHGAAAGAGRTGLKGRWAIPSVRIRFQLYETISVFLTLKYFLRIRIYGSGSGRKAT
jgi:hypothetical protein